MRRTRSTERSPTLNDRPLALDLELVSEGRPHARQEFLHAERLGDVVVCAEIQRFDLGGLVAAAREHDNGHVFALSPDFAQEIEPLHVRQPEIEDDEIGRLCHQLERRLGIWRVDGLVALRAQSHAQQFADWRLVVDDQHSEGRSGHAAVSRCSAGLGTGSVTVKTAPGRSERLPATMVPPMASTKPREIASPSPVPA